MIISASRISLKPEAVDCIVFWTKDPAPMLKHLEALKDYRYYVQVSITPYGRDIEVNLRPKAEIIKTVQEMSKVLGRYRQTCQGSQSQEPAAFVQLCGEL